MELDWEIVISVCGTIAVVSAAVGAVVGFFSWLKRKFFPPKIEVTFDVSQTFHNRRDAISGVDHVWIHVRARNPSAKRYNQCKAYVTAVWEGFNTKDSYRLEEFNSKIPLVWAHSSGEKEMDLLPGETTSIDLFIVDNRRRLLLFATDQTPAGTQKWLEPGEYVVQVACLSSNGADGRIRLEVTWDGRPNGVKIRAI